MTASVRKTIGLDRPIRMEWLDAVAGQLASGASPDATREYVWKMLDGVVAGSTAHTARGKTMTVLARVWLAPSMSARGLRDDALAGLSGATPDERVAIHWAMMSAAYPFFVDVAELVGNGLALHREVRLTQLSRRLTDLWGDRSTLHPAAQRIVRSMVQWHVLQDGQDRGQFVATVKRLVVRPQFTLLLIEGLLLSRPAGLPSAQLRSHPALFPFEVRVDVGAIRSHPRLHAIRSGDGGDTIHPRVAVP